MGSSNQPCETYFVESDDQQVHKPHGRDYLKMLARQRQDAMASELSRQAADDYLEDVLEHMQAMENETLPDVASIDIQEEIQWFMRPYLLDFLVEAHAAFQLLPETLFLTINLLDRYCSRRVVYKKHYQLVGCASLLIAAKYGDRKDRVPTIRELKSMCCSLYDEDMFTQMEWHVLNTLDWVVGHPTVDSFLQVYLVDVALTTEFEDAEVQHMAWYLCEIALYNKEFVSTRPSVMARASLALSRSILGRPDASDLNLEEDAHMTMMGMMERLYTPSQVLARKYSSTALSEAATTLERAKQAAVFRRGCPPTPPIDSDRQMQDVSGDIYNTPQKAAHGVDPNGYLTPPITPDGYFVDEVRGYAQHGGRRSYTPSRMGNGHHVPMQHPSQQQYTSNNYSQDTQMY